MIVATRRRKESPAKINKDMLQAKALVKALSNRRSLELGEALDMAESNGPKWKSAIEQACKDLDPDTLSLLQKARDSFASAR